MHNSHQLWSGNIVSHLIMVSFLIFIMHISESTFSQVSQGVCVREINITETEVEKYTVTSKGRCKKKNCKSTGGIISEVRTRSKTVLKRKNETYCCDGYRGAKDICEPVCDPPCVNGTCVAPGNCSCLSGYQMPEGQSTHHVCEPVCDPPCVNGTCVAPGNCLCLSGYQMPEGQSTLHVCEPVCSRPCHNGRCVAPEVCQCDERFQKVEHGTNEGICEPVCSRPCQNGYCSAPDTCSCHEGYTKIFWDSFKCGPVCKPECVNGNCYKPQVCECKEGYIKDEEKPHICNPSCSPTCNNGRCASFNVCVCFEGYQMTSSGVCEPICSDPCINGNCVSPEKCSCNEGFVLTIDNTENTCKPFCRKKCVNGECSAPEECSCFDGYRKTGLYNCEAVCSQGCIHSECSEPEKCVCWDGYELDTFLNNTCNPICSKECINGRCEAPEKCVCLDGFVPTEDSFICSPVCSEPCLGAKCVAPNTCECSPGFKKRENSSNICVPHCTLGCINADCKGRDTCECLDGYKKSPVDHICVAVCSVCEHGNCVAPETCIDCFDGFRNPPKNFSRCIPYCEKPCTNGVCVEPNVCSCEEGYRKDETEGNVCTPHCSKECANGECIRPEFCECFPGYQKDLISWNECNPVCSKDCESGICSASEVCTCFWGFTSKDNSSKCSYSESSGQNLYYFFEYTLREDSIRKSQVRITNGTESYFLQSIIQKLIKNVVLLIKCKFLSAQHYVVKKLTCELEKQSKMDTDKLESNKVYLKNHSRSLNDLQSTPTTQSDLLQFETNFSNSYVDGETVWDTSHLEISTVSSDLNTSQKYLEYDKFSSSSSPLMTNFSIFIDFTSFIKSEEITGDYFNDIENETEISAVWCICPKNVTWPLGVNDEVEFLICQCEETTQNIVVDGDVPLLVDILLGIFIFFFVASAVVSYYRCKGENKRNDFSNQARGQNGSVECSSTFVYNPSYSYRSSNPYQIPNIFLSDSESDSSNV